MIMNFGFGITVQYSTVPSEAWDVLMKYCILMYVGLWPYFYIQIILYVELCSTVPDLPKHHTVSNSG